MLALQTFAITSALAALSSFTTLPTSEQLWSDDVEKHQTCGVMKDAYQANGCCGADREKRVKTMPLTTDMSDCYQPVYIYCDVVYDSRVFQAQNSGGQPDYERNEDTITGDVWTEWSLTNNSYALYHMFARMSNYYFGDAAHRYKRQTLYGESPEVAALQDNDIGKYRGIVTELYPNSFAAFDSWTAIKMNTDYNMGNWFFQVETISGFGICDTVLNYGNATNNPFKLYGMRNGKIEAGGYSWAMRGSGSKYEKNWTEYMEQKGVDTSYTDSKLWHYGEWNPYSYYDGDPLLADDPTCVDVPLKPLDTCSSPPPPLEVSSGEAASGA